MVAMDGSRKTLDFTVLQLVLKDSGLSRSPVTGHGCLGDLLPPRRRHPYVCLKLLEFVGGIRCSLNKSHQEIRMTCWFYS